MKILFVSDFSIKTHHGGAEVSNDMILKKGIELGHDIKYHNLYSPIEDFNENYDLIISSNLGAISIYEPEKIQKIINSKNHIRYEHDSCLYLTEENRKKLFNSSKINFFLSEFHINFFKEYYGDYFKNVEIVYDPINSDLFKIDNLEKKYDIVYCGNLSKLKGIENLLNFAHNNQNRHVSIFGWSEEFDCNQLNNFPNISFYGKITHNETAKVFQQARGVFHSPILNEPFCRMVAEAILCGIKEFYGIDNKIGSIQEYKKIGIEKFSESCYNASNIFWKKIYENKHLLNSI